MREINNAPHAVALEKIAAPIESVELFRLDVEAERHFSHGVWHNRQLMIPAVCKLLTARGAFSQ